MENGFLLAPDGIVATKGDIMKKTEGELLREYSQMISEADGNPDNWRDFEPEGASEPTNNGNRWDTSDEEPGDEAIEDNNGVGEDDADPTNNGTDGSSPDWGPGDFNDDDEGDGSEPDGPETKWDFNDKEGDGSEQEVDGNDPVTELGDLLNSKFGGAGDDFVELIDKFLKEKNLEIVPIGGLTNQDGNI
jgi:hypothetical protein